MIHKLSNYLLRPVFFRPQHRITPTSPRISPPQQSAGIGQVFCPVWGSFSGIWGGFVVVGSSVSGSFSTSTLGVASTS